jgi:hypothetical protein
LVPTVKVRGAYLKKISSRTQVQVVARGKVVPSGSCYIVVPDDSLLHVSALHIGTGLVDACLRLASVDLSKLERAANESVLGQSFMIAALKRFYAMACELSTASWYAALAAVLSCVVAALAIRSW